MYQRVAGHTQICVYTTFVLGLFTLFFVFYQEKGRRLRFLILCALPVILGGLIALPQLFATAQLLSHTYYAHLPISSFVSYSFPPLALPMLVSPFLFGGGYSHGPQWGNTFVLEESGFVGVLPLVISAWVFARKNKENPQVRFWGIAALAAFFLVFGKYNPFDRLFFHVPGMIVFRAPARNWFEFDFATAILFGFGMEELIYCVNDRKKYEILPAVMIGIPLLLLFLLLLMKNLYLLPLLPSYSPFQMHEIVRCFHFFNPVFLIPFFFITADLLLILGLSFASGFKKIIIFFLTLSLFAEFFSFATFQQNEWLKISTAQKFLNNPVFQFLERHIGFNRYGVVEEYSPHKILMWPLLNIPSHLSEIDGYDPMVINRFYKLAGIGYGTGDLPVWNVLLKNNLILSLFNVKYLVVPSSLKTEMRKMKFDDKFYQTKGEFLKGNWLLSSVSKLHKIYYLKSHETLHPSIMVKKLQIKPGKIYWLSFKAKALRKPSSNLDCDFIVANKPYSSDKPLLIIHPGEIRRRFRTFFALFIGNFLTRAYVRIYTNSKNLILVQKPKIFYFKKYRPFFLKGRQKQFALMQSNILYHKITKWKSYSVYENLNALPRIFSIQKLQVAQNFRRFKKSLFLLKCDPFRDAFVSSKSFSKIRRSRFTRGKVVLVKHGADRIIARTNFRKTGFVVLSDQYYPG